MLKLEQFAENGSDRLINMLVANQGIHIYYIALTDELRLSKQKFPDGNLIMTLDEETELELGPVLYVGEL